MIAYTPYSRTNRQFTERAHELAQQQVYPDMFGVAVEQIDYQLLKDDTARAFLLDTAVAVDRLLRVTVKHLRMPITFDVQERFRRPQYHRFQDITITEWNHNTNQPSELYKIRAGWFVYGYYDDQRGVFLDVVAIPVPELLWAITSGRLPHKTGDNPRSNQTFVAVRIPDLHHHCLMAVQDERR